MHRTRAGHHLRAGTLRVDARSLLERIGNHAEKILERLAELRRERRCLRVRFEERHQHPDLGGLRDGTAGRIDRRGRAGLTLREVELRGRERGDDAAVVPIVSRLDDAIELLLIAKRQNAPVPESRRLVARKLRSGSRLIEPRHRDRRVSGRHAGLGERCGSGKCKGHGYAGKEFEDSHGNVTDRGAAWM
jgi:hypothetical protein